ncbi:hypothetical protein Syun_028270 [Stephania yunnanensis]|uniref:Uncharacterized protein n=1 Tax=Stephania yunnanensis TaxID=152371 RepID=A0AAP0HNM1_9MAGN
MRLASITEFLSFEALGGKSELARVGFHGGEPETQGPKEGRRGPKEERSGDDERDGGVGEEEEEEERKKREVFGCKIGSGGEIHEAEEESSRVETLSDEQMMSCCNSVANSEQMLRSGGDVKQNACSAFEDTSYQFVESVLHPRSILFLCIHTVSSYRAPG